MLNRNFAGAAHERYRHDTGRYIQTTSSREGELDTAGAKTFLVCSEFLG